MDRMRGWLQNRRFSPRKSFGVFQGTYYIVPSYKVYERNFNFVPLIIRHLLKEPNPTKYSNFHFYGTEYDSYESVVEGKVIYLAWISSFIENLQKKRKSLKF